MRIVIRAFNKDGYHKDIIIADNQQVRQNDIRIKEPIYSIHSGLIGFGGQIAIEDFPEMTHFELVIKD